MTRYSTDKTTGVPAAGKDANGKCMADIAAYRLLRVLAVWAVVLLHALYVSYNLFQTQLSGAVIEWAALLTNELLWAVPCFLMVTGALLLTPEKPLTCRKVYTRYLPRILGALVVWTPLFALFDVVASGTPMNGERIVEAFRHIIVGDGWTHLWYLYLLIGLYLLMPFFQRALIASSRRELYVLTGILVVFLSIVPFLQSTGFVIGFTIPVTTIFPLYLLLGYGLRTGRFRRLGIPLFLAGTAASGFIFIYMMRTGLETKGSWFWSYASLFIIVQAVGLFLTVQRLFRNHRSGRILRLLDETSFGVYLLHMVFIRLLFHHWRINLLNRPLLFALAVIGIYLLSFILTAVGRRVPLLRKIL
ncbi:MAG: acyltransferase family protein [Eubacteriales bacterium]|nr:acyltransferase family protein [Eubacteriales bacterium]